MDLISVIVPVYNVEKYLERCIESIQAQTYRNLEIIFVEDGSPDRCGEICEQFKTQDSRIKVVHKQNEGLGLTRNRGLLEVTGKYVIFIDSDDWIGPKHIENMYNYLKDNDADLCLGGHTKVYQNGSQIECSVKLNKIFYSKNEIEDQIILPLIGSQPEYQNDILLESSCCMNMYKTSVIKENNIQFISERYAVAEDLYFNIDYLNFAQNVVISTNCSYYYFENTNSISRKYDQRRFERTLNFYDEVTSKVVKYCLENKIGYRLDRSYITKIRVAIRHIVISDLKFSDKIDKINQIVSNNVSKAVLKNYPIEKYIPAMRILIKQMQLGHPLRVYILMKTREFARSITIVKKVLHRVGIGK